MSYTVSKIADVIHAGIVGKGDLQTAVHDVLIDSRKLLDPGGSLFFAIKGDRHDAHRFISELYKKGICCFVVSDIPANTEAFPRAVFLKVDDTLLALQQLSAWHRSHFHIPVIGITGSNGKTIVKEWLYQLLQENHSIIRSPKSFNSQVGVPLSVWPLAAEHDLAIFEAGISKPGEMERLERIIAPTMGIITNIGQAHDENFKDLYQKAEEKLHLFKNAETIIYCKDYLVIRETVEEKDELRNKQIFTWSRKTKADLQVGKISKSVTGTEIQAVYKNEFVKIQIPFSDEASIENVIHCWAVMLLLGYEQQTITGRMAQLSPVAMRLELKEGINHCSIINDSYNSDLGSLGIALDFLNQQQQHPRKTLILSDILQSGRTEESLYGEVSDLLLRKGVNKLIGIGEAISRQSGLFKCEKSFYPSTQEFLRHYNPGLFRDETILLKGARSFGFEELSKAFQQKAHETVLEVDLGAVVHNLNYFRSKLPSGVKIMAMVKAFSYGSGSFEIANVLQFNHVDYLAVAYSDEGVELRKAGITLPIMVMNPEEQSYDSMIQYNLEPEIFSFRVLGLFDEAVRRNRMMMEGQGRIQIHLKLDTGMHRLGFEEKDINELVVRIGNSKQLSIRSVFSHLAGSDEQEHDAFTLTQISRFAAMSAAIQRHFDYPVWRHILNSAGISRFPSGAFDMVRLGIGLYGIGKDQEEQQLLRNVSTLKTTISQIRNIPAGDTIGYSRKGMAKENMVIATVPIGYADGLSRRLSNGKGSMLVGGKPASVVGNVCMDMCMIDITHISAREGDEVIVFGDAYPITKLAKDLGTIPYEVLTNVSRRVKRVYFQE
ncbi:MAG: bifunctional UDP-N-acetylmuramoyl-tripeptide:D-alanyl-D-alanine ligase/alanine racemase [Bacteroidia bacterium]